MYRDCCTERHVVFLGRAGSDTQGVIRVTAQKHRSGFGCSRDIAMCFV
jgi:hypothetical protein